MPHLVLEYTSNITPQIPFKAVFAALHILLQDIAQADIDSCKSRAEKRDEYHIGSGSPNQAFVHLEISMLAGRTELAKKQLGQAALTVLEQHFHDEAKKLALQITVKITDMPTELYFKSSMRSG